METRMGLLIHFKQTTISIHGPIHFLRRRTFFSGKDGSCLPGSVITRPSSVSTGFRFPVLFLEIKHSVMNLLPAWPFQKRLHPISCYMPVCQKDSHHLLWRKFCLPPEASIQTCSPKMGSVMKPV